MNKEQNKQQLPKDWKWVKLGEVCERMSNGANATQFEEKVGFPISRIETIWNETIDLGRVKYIKESEAAFKEKYSLQKDDILFSHINSDIHLGKTAIFKIQTTTLIHGINLLLIRLSRDVSADFFNYQFKYKRKKGDFIAIAQKAVNQSSINQQKLKNTDFVLPPFPTQLAIVAKIEELFSELDKGIEQLKTAQQQLKTYRQSVLLAAIEGNYTEEWRKKNKSTDIKEFLIKEKKSKKLNFEVNLELPQNWASIKLDEISERVSVGHVGPTSEFYTSKKEGIPFIRSQNVRKGFLDFDGLQYITKEFHLKLKKSKLKPGDLLIVRVGANRGDACLLPDNLGEINCANIVFARPLKELGKFLHYYFISPAWTNLIAKLTTGSAQGVINTTIVAETIINFPSLEEQQQIVQEIESRLSVADKMEESINQSLQQAEVLRQSILKKAFEGRLV